MKQEKLSPEDELASSQEIAEHLKIIMLSLDMMSENIGIEKIKYKLNRMKEPLAVLEALPFSETLRRGEVMRAQCNVMSSVIELMKVRQECVEILKKGAVTPGQDVLKQLGFA